MAHEPRRKSLFQQLADLPGNGQNLHRQTTASPMATAAVRPRGPVSTVTPLLRRRRRAARCHPGIGKRPRDWLAGAARWRTGLTEGTAPARSQRMSPAAIRVDITAQ
jgi:hypothetical protein